MRTLSYVRVEVEHDGSLSEKDISRGVELAVEDCLTFEPAGRVVSVRQLKHDGFGRLLINDKED